MQMMCYVNLFSSLFTFAGLFFSVGSGAAKLLSVCHNRPLKPGSRGRLHARARSHERTADRTEAHLCTETAALTRTRAHLACMDRVGTGVGTKVPRAHGREHVHGRRAAFYAHERQRRTRARNRVRTRAACLRRRLRAKPHARALSARTDGCTDRPRTSARARARWPRAE
eukprot:6185580-Pleurochrysis_carterae.AAC.8